LAGERFPTISAENLSRERKELPKDFTGRLNVIVIAFRQDQVGLLSSWEPFLEGLEEECPGVRFYELPTLSSSFSPIRWWIDGGMRGGIRSPMARERTITLYTKKRDFKKALSIPNEDDISVMLLEESRVVWRTEGEYTKEKFDGLRREVEARLGDRKR
jgi:hypothetical protein